MKSVYFNRLTKLGNGVPMLKSKLKSEKAVSRLFEYENTGYTPREVTELKETIYNLQERIKKSEDW